MGNKASAEVFAMQEGIPEKNIGPTIGVYLDYSQFPLAGIFGVSSNCIVPKIVFFDGRGGE